MKKFLLTFLIILPFLGFSQEDCPYLTSYKTQNNKHRFISIGAEGDKIIQIDSLKYYTYTGFHIFFVDSIKCEPYTGKLINHYGKSYSICNIINGYDIGLSRYYSKSNKLETLRYTTDTLFLSRFKNISTINFTDFFSKTYNKVKIFYYKNGMLKMKSSSYYYIDKIFKKEKIILKNRQELENYFLENKYYKFLKSLYFFDEFPTEVYDSSNSKS